MSSRPTIRYIESPRADMTDATEMLVDAVLALAESDLGKALREAHQERLAKRNAGDMESVNQQLASIDKSIRKLERIAAAEHEALVKYYGALGLTARDRNQFDKLS